MMNLYVTGGVGFCKSCGFAAPALDMCRLADTCVECARKTLGEKCKTCLDKHKCDVAIDGVKFMKRLEPQLDVYVDLGKRVAALLEQYGRVELGVAFLKNLVGLVKLLDREKKEMAFPLWVSSIFREGVVAKLVKTPYIVKLDLGKPLGAFCSSFNCSGLETPLNNLLNALVSLSLLEDNADPRHYFRLGV